MPLTFADINVEYVIKRIQGNPEVKKHLEDIGFVPGANISVIASIGGDLIVSVKGSKIGIDIFLANKILI